MNKFKDQGPSRPLGRVLSKHLGSTRHYSRMWMWVCPPQDQTKEMQTICHLSASANCSSNFPPFLTFPTSNSHFLSYFPSASTSSPPSPASLFSHNPAHVRSLNFELLISRTLLLHLASIKLRTQRLELLLYLLLSFLKHKFKPTFHIYRRQSGCTLLISCCPLSFLLSDGRDDLQHLKQGQGHLPISK